MKYTFCPKNMFKFDFYPLFFFLEKKYNFISKQLNKFTKYKFYFIYGQIYFG